MSGHSKWQTTKRTKDAADKKRGKIFSKIAYAIVVAAREGGSDPTTNTKLKTAIEKAKAANMPKDNIERAIAKANGGDEGALEEARYEIIGPAGSMLIVETLSDNKNRTVSEIKHIVSKHNGSLAAPGSVLWQFTQRGQLEVPSVVNQDVFEEDAIEAGADDIEINESTQSALLFTKPHELEAVKHNLESKNRTVTDGTLVFQAQNPVSVTAPEEEKIKKFLEALEDQQDVQDIYLNTHIT